MLWGQMLIWGHLGSLGSKSHFHHKCYNLSMLHIMTIYSYKVLISICFRSSVTFVGSVTDNLGSVRGQCLKSRQGTPSVTATCLVLSSSSFFFFFWQHAFFTYFPTSDFDQTWSQWPVPWPLLRHKRWWGQGSLWGHWGQKGHFHQKGIKSFRLHSIDGWLMHMQ